ncbi:fibronectin type III domain-containing protein 7-like [Paramisgurnus dabryanus]|uniref:fibronectin type III domain-containing protein 7-like n=1 Tax=Paramisgurnus dabryanus TaxID=90735 RepID=UPI003CCF1E82
MEKPPAVITEQQTGTQSVHISWQAVEKVLVYQVTVRNLSSTIFSNRVFTTTLDLYNITPCSSFQVSISSVNALLEAGEPRDVNYSTNILSAVTAISVDYRCVTSSAVVSWAAVLGATAYRAVAVSHNGTVLSCTSSRPQCQLSNLLCDENYEVHVTAMSNNCQSTEGNSTYFQTGPCPPTDLMLYRECSSNVIVFSWSPNNFSAYYFAQAVDSTGKVMECMTTESSCFFTDTVCGRHYNFTIYGSSASVSEQCNSALSPVMNISTAPCQPTYMDTSTNCQTDVLTSNWDASNGALQYRVDAFGNRGNYSHYVCNSVTQSCNISGIQCGESLTMLITAMDDECSSSLAIGQVAQTSE